MLFRDNFGIDALLSLLESDGDICHKHAKMDIVEFNEDAVAIFSTNSTLRRGALMNDHLNECFTNQ